MRWLWRGWLWSVGGETGAGGVGEGAGVIGGVEEVMVPDTDGGDVDVELLVGQVLALLMGSRASVGHVGCRQWWY